MPLLFFLAATIADPQCNESNAIVRENALPGNSSQFWDVNAAGDPSIQGFSDRSSYVAQDTVNFHVKTAASSWRVDVFRLGWYGGLGARKVTLSTVGFPDRVREIATTSPPFQLAISLHTPFDSERDLLVPAMKGVPIEEVLSAGDAWFEETGREITYEYVLLGEHNDTPDHAYELGQRLRGRRANVNLIPWNPLSPSPSDPTMPRYRRPRAEVVTGFQGDLQEAGVITTVRWSRGLESDAACGQLRLHP